MIGEIADTGATAIELSVSWAQRDVSSVAIRPGKVAVPDRTLRRAIRTARRHRLRVLVLPILIVEQTSRGKWRGTIAPRDVGRWWQAYERFVLHYAAIAAAERADAFAVGSELGSTEAWQDRWYHLISRVERAFTGDIVYSANWDHYEQVSFWRRLDALGISSYQPLARDPDAGEAELLRGWRAQRDRLIAHARERGLPLWITEVGYTSIDGTATAPWDYTRGGDIDHDEQRRCYAAFVRAWAGAPELSAVFFWQWNGPGGAADRGYTPHGKPAESVLRAWFASSKATSTTAER